MWYLKKIAVGNVVSKLEGTELIEPKTSTDEHKLILWFVLYGRPSPQVWFKATGHFFLEKLFSYQRVFPEELRGFLASLHTDGAWESRNLPHLPSSHARILTTGRDQGLTGKTRQLLLKVIWKRCASVDLQCAGTQLSVPLCHDIIWRFHCETAFHSV